jgi:error-prone DNA polymerase
VLARTFGVPIFQEQVMQLAVVAASFTPGEADRLRRAMAAWRARAGWNTSSRNCWPAWRPTACRRPSPGASSRRSRASANTAFPNRTPPVSRLLVYASAWLKRHHPAAFLCGLLNSQPMGFYSPSLLIQDARRHGVAVLPPDVNASDRDSRLDADGAVRLGLREIGGLSRAVAERVAVDRQKRPFSSVADLAARSRLQRRDLDLLAAADALRSLAGHRRQAAWAATAAVVQGDLFDGLPPPETASDLPSPSAGENLVADYRSLGLTLRRHPLTLLRQPSAGTAFRARPRR